MITRPLGLELRLSPPPRSLDLAFWVSGILIVQLFGLVFSRFVLAPGVFVGAGSTGFEPPHVGGPAQLVATSRVAVSYRRDDVIMFEGAWVKPAELRRLLTAYARQHPGEVLLVLADRQVSIQALMELSAMAREAGFGGLFFGGEPQSSGATEPQR
jgi:hypothetical protein